MLLPHMQTPCDKCRWSTERVSGFYRCRLEEENSQFFPAMFQDTELMSNEVRQIFGRQRSVTPESAGLETQMIRINFHNCPQIPMGPATFRDRPSSKTKTPLSGSSIRSIYCRFCRSYSRPRLTVALERRIRAVYLQCRTTWRYRPNELIHVLIEIRKILS